MNARAIGLNTCIDVSSASAASVPTETSREQGPRFSMQNGAGFALVADSETPKTRPASAPAYTDNVTRATPGEVSIGEVQQDTGVARKVKYTEIDTKGGKDFTETQLFGGQPSDLIIAVDTGGRTQGHMYLIMDGVRVDGRMFFAPHTEDAEAPVLSKGLVLRYKNIPAENKRLLKEWVRSDSVIRSPTCVDTAMKILFEHGGFKMPVPHRHLFPSAFLKDIARDDLVGADGKKIVPEVVTINEDIRPIWEHLPSWMDVPKFFFGVLFDPYTWKGRKTAAKAAPAPAQA